MMNNKFIKSTVITLLLSLTCFYNIHASEDRIIAVVNDEVITTSEMETSGTKVFPSKSLSFLIEKKLQLQVAKKKGISVYNEEIEETLNDIKKMNGFKSDTEMEEALLKEGASLEDYKREIKEQLIILKLINREIKSKISASDKEVEEYYQLHKGSYILPESIRIGYVNITVKSSDSEDDAAKTSGKINSILADLNNNISLSELKRRYSDSREINVVNDLGFIKKGNLLPELESVAFSLNEGELSNVIKTSSGFYIIKMIERKKIEYKPIEDIRENIRDIVLQEKSERIYKDWLYDLKSSSYINIFI